MAQVTVPADFFRNELRIYSDWRTSFARELLQNATDARPSKIEIAFEDRDGHGRVTFRDDGDGMSRAVLEDVFFALGRTTKEGTDSIGGFGRARIIICFAQVRYTISTGNLRVEGHGGEYTISEVDDFVKGCEFTVDLIDETFEQVARAFRQLLRTCSIRVPVTIDGEPAPTREMPSRATRVLRDTNGLPWGRAYVSNGYGMMNVRVHGLTMFDRWLSTSDHVILELEPGRSRELLSASRDRLLDEYATQVDKFVADLAGNRRAALRPEVTPLDVHVGGGGFLVSDADSQPGSDGRDHDDDATEGGATRTAALSDAGTGLVRATPANDAAFENMLASLAAGAGQLDFDVEVPDRSPLGFDVFMLADRSDARVRKLAKVWDPTGWDERTGRRRRALLFAWKAAVGYALDTLVKERPHLGRVVWTVGWTFDSDVRAVHKSVSQGHVLALNPVTDTGTSRYQVSQRASRQQLLAIAAHEVSHIVSSGHDETFASVLTDLFAAMDPALADRLIREAHARA